MFCARDDRLTKQVLLSLVAIQALACTVLSIPSLKESYTSFLHYALYFLTSLVLLYVTNLNHHTSRSASSLVLVFWPAYFLACAIRIRTMILTGDLSSHLTETLAGRLILARESLWIASVTVGLVDCLLELFSPEKRWARWKAPWSKEGKIALDDSDDEGEDVVDDVAVSKSEYGDVESPVLTANIYER